MTVPAQAKEALCRLSNVEVDAVHASSKKRQIEGNTIADPKHQKTNTGPLLSWTCVDGSQTTATTSDHRTSTRCSGIMVDPKMITTGRAHPNGPSVTAGSSMSASNLTSPPEDDELHILPPEAKQNNLPTTRSESPLTPLSSASSTGDKECDGVTKNRELIVESVSVESPGSPVVVSGIIPGISDPETPNADKGSVEMRSTALSP
ncbi:hypothetical protein MPER_07881, partial [Moniliophthora perniciosa FA553]